MSGIGPVEPIDSSETDGSYDVIGTDAPRLTDRWNALSPRTRKAAAAAGVIAFAATGVVLFPPSNRAATDETAQVPWPANATGWRYLGLAQTTDSPTTSGYFRFAVTVHSGTPVTLRVTGTAFDGLTAHATPDPAFTVQAGTTRRITVEISVSNCYGLPLNADLPFLDVTLRNTRAIQHHSFIFGGAFSRDLSELLHKACDPGNAQ